MAIESLKTKGGAGELALQVVENPCAIWYKDVGGKKNTMFAEVALVGDVPAGQRFRLRTALYFESGKRIEDEWQWVLKIDDDSLPLLDAQSRRAGLHFRIEKVSTSFMGQRFRVRVEATPVVPMADGAPPLEVFTSPIESKAKPRRCPGSKPARATKRRSNATLTSHGATRSKRRRRPSMAAMEARRAVDEELARTTEELHETQERLKRTEETLGSVVGQLDQMVTRVVALEERLRILRPPLGNASSSLTRPPLTRFNSDCSIGSTSFLLTESISSAAGETVKMEKADGDGAEAAPLPQVMPMNLSSAATGSAAFAWLGPSLSPTHATLSRKLSKGG